MKINFKKLKKDMDEDKDFLHWDTDEKVSITCIKFPNNTDWKTNYRVSVESNQDEDLLTTQGSVRRGIRGNRWRRQPHGVG